MILSLIKNQHLRNLVKICAAFALGWTANQKYLEIQELTCNTYVTKYATWTGFLSTKNGDQRCFWLESAYPNRVRQGVPVQ